MTDDSPGAEDFDYRQPFEVDIGRAAVIAEALREHGYAHCTADVVTAELAKSESERGMVGRFAADALEQAGAAMIRSAVANDGVLPFVSAVRRCRSSR